MERIYTDIAIIGGGAAGLAAAVAASARSDYKVTIIERNPRVGKKLLQTGNGRCNLSNLDLSPDHFFGERTLAARILRETPPAQDFFRSLGLHCRADSEGRVYPYPNTAASVLDALRLRLANSSVEELCNFPAFRLEPLLEGFAIHGQMLLSAKYPGYASAQPPLPLVMARRVIIATGSGAGLEKGAADPYQLIRSTGHTVVEPVPTLCPIFTEQRQTRPLKGQRIKALCHALIDERVVRSEYGEVQFGDGQLSGIAIFNLSRIASMHKEKVTIALDLMPEADYRNVLELLGATLSARPGCTVDDVFTGIFPKRLAVTLLKTATPKTMSAPASTLTKKELEDLARLIKHWRFPVRGAPHGATHGTPRFPEAQAAAGGVPASELNDDLSSKRSPHLYFAGEAVNVDGDCGGYNLAWAWASGAACGRAAIDN